MTRRGTRDVILGLSACVVLALAPALADGPCPCYYQVSPPGQPVQYWALAQPLVRVGAGAPGLYAFAVAITADQVPEASAPPSVCEHSTGSAFADACFALDSTTQGQLSGLAATVALLGTFPGGQTAYAYPDVTSVPVVFASTDAFRAMYGGYVGYLQAMQAALAQGQDPPSRDVVVP